VQEKAKRLFARNEEPLDELNCWQALQAATGQRGTAHLAAKLAPARVNLEYQQTDFHSSFQEHRS
jgi:hypothetical protein